MCYSGIYCKNEACQRVHGEFDPQQAEFYASRGAGQKWGRVACAHHLKTGHCWFATPHQCQYRHFIHNQNLIVTEMGWQAIFDMKTKK